MTGTVKKSMGITLFCDNFWTPFIDLSQIGLCVATF